jgi:hypothetical protein
MYIPMTKEQLFCGVVIGLVIAFVLLANYCAAIRDRTLEREVDRARAMYDCNGVLVVVRGAHGESWSCGKGKK